VNVKDKPESLSAQEAPGSSDRSALSRQLIFVLANLTKCIYIAIYNIQCKYMQMRAQISSFIAKCLLFLVALPLPAQSGEKDKTNPVVHMSERDGEIRWTTDIAQALPVFRTREAKQVIATLLPNQKLTILEMDKFGFHVRGKAKNGYASGWTGWKSLLGNAPDKHVAMENFRQRQHELLSLIDTGRPAIGMTFDEIKLALGDPTQSDVSISESKRTRSAIWTKKKSVDSEDILGPLAILTMGRELEIDAGAITAQLINGVVTAVQIDIEGDNTEGAELAKPVQIPFSQVTFDRHESVADRR